jgi:hypothetical protein
MNTQFNQNGKKVQKIKYPWLLSLCTKAAIIKYCDNAVFFLILSTGKNNKCNQVFKYF